MTHHTTKSGVSGLALWILSATLTLAQVPAPAAVQAGAPRFVEPEATKRSGFPLLFVENHGRYEDLVRFHLEYQDGAILVMDRGIVFRDRGRDDLVLTFPGSYPRTIWQREARTPTVVHYLIGKEKEWQTDVPTFRKLLLANIWPGIDLLLLGDRGAVKYEFHVAPGSDPGRIRMRYAGATLSLDADGNLEVRDTIGLRRIDPAPVAFQGKDNGKEPVDASFSLVSGSLDAAGFKVGAYERSRPLVIDPAFLTYCGYLPPGMHPFDTAVDVNGAAVVVGLHSTQSNNDDACIVRISPDGTGFDFVTYLGGQGNDAISGVAVDSSGIYLGGGTYSDENSFPVKNGPCLKHNGNCDGFVCKLALDGKTSFFCGYIGGVSYDSLGPVSIDSIGSIWLAGRTWSPDYPVLGGPQLKMPGPEPACVTKVAPDGRSLVFSGFIGGSSPWTHFCTGLAVDGQGNGYVTGITTSDEKQYAFPVKIGPRTVYGGGSADTFLCKIDGRTGGFLYSGFIGGSDYDCPWDLAVDAHGAAYVTGQTFSSESTFPVVGGPLTRYMPSYNRGDGFLAKVNPGGTGFVYSGYLGGAVGQGIALDAMQRCYLGGNMPPITPPFPVGGALAPANAGGLDGILMRISPDGRTFEYAGFLGGAGDDNITALALGPRNTIHVSGVTLSHSTFPLRIGPSFTYNPAPTPGAYGSFVAKIAEASIVASGTGKLGTAITFTLNANDDAGLVYQAGTSLSAGPSPIGTRAVGLGLDALLVLSVGRQAPSIFEAYTGTINANGSTTTRLHIPNHPALIGLRPHTAFVTMEPRYPLGIKSISDTAAFTVMP